MNEKNLNLIAENKKPIETVQEIDNAWEQELVEYFWNKEIVNQATQENNFFVQIEFQNCNLKIDGVQKDHWITYHGEHQELLLNKISEVERLIQAIEKKQVRIVNNSWFGFASENSKTRRTTTALLRSLRTIIQQFQACNSLLTIISLHGESGKASVRIKHNWTN